MSAPTTPFVTYRMADGSLVASEYEFVTQTEWFDEDTFDEDTVVIKETWALVSTETITQPSGEEATT